MLAELGLTDDNAKSMIEVLNKSDLIPADDLATLTERVDGQHLVLASALTGDGCDDLMAAIDGALASQRTVVELDVAHADGKTLAWLYRRGQVLSREDGETGAHLTVALDPADVARLEQGLQAQ